MDQAQKDRLMEEAKQRQFLDIIEKSSNGGDPSSMKDEILAVNIVEAQTLRGLVDHIFNKAAEDIGSHTILAELCQLMPAKFDPAEAPASLKEKGAGSRGTSEKGLDFRLLVLKTCKSELDAGAKAKKAIKGWEAKEEKAKLKGEDKENAEADRAAFARMLNIIQFCGALYTAGILTEKIIHSCIESFLNKEDEPRAEHLEILCKLLKKIGTKLDGSTRSSKDGKVVNSYFEKMKKIQDDAVSKNVVKMMSEVLTLREEKWVSAS